MNKVINVVSCIVLVLFSILVMVLVFDLTLSSTLSLKNMPYQEPICAGMALVVLLLGMLRIKRRWQGIKDIRRFNHFIFSTHVGSAALRHGLTFSVVETIFGLLFIGLFAILYSFSPILLIPMLSVLSLLTLESVYFASRLVSGNPKTFRLGIDKKGIAYFDREIHLIYFSGLRKIEVHQDMINFQYKDVDLNIFMNINVIPKEDRVDFRNNLIQSVEKYTSERNKKTVFIDEAFRTFQ